MMFSHITLPNPGVTTGTLPSHIFQEVIKEIKELERDDEGYIKMNTMLAGQIEKEYHLKKSQVLMNPFLEQMATEYSKNFNYHPNHNFEVKSLWVNFQQKTEYNPIHNHEGLLSFVCWMQIPYHIQDEYNVVHSQNSRIKTASTFQFVYSSILGEITHETLEVSQDWAGRIVMFPSKLLHTVYPFFTSNEYRISVAGNIS